MPEHDMTSHRRLTSMDVIQAVKLHHVGMIAAMAMEDHRARFGDKCVYPNIRNFFVREMQYSIEDQRFAMVEGLIMRFARVNGFRGVFSAMHEGLNHVNEFARFCKDILSAQYVPFKALVQLCRNVYSLDIVCIRRGEIILSKSDYERTVRSWIKRQHSMHLKVSISYRDLLHEGEFEPSYGFTIDLDLRSLKPGKLFSSVIPDYNQSMLGECCYNVCEFLHRKIER